MWTVEYIADADKPGVGWMTATYTDETTTYTYRRRCALGGDDETAFVVAAKEGLAAKAAKEAADATRAAAVEARLNRSTTHG